MAVIYKWVGPLLGLQSARACFDCGEAHLIAPKGIISGVKGSFQTGQELTGGDADGRT
jgi:hypothetical protein